MNVYKQNNSLEVLKKPEGAVGGPKRQGFIYFLNDLKIKVFVRVVNLKFLDQC